jgi:predicted transcriptional regulator
MILREVQRILQAEVLVGEDNLELEVNAACGSDLMSDVLAFTKPGALLLTGLTNTQAIRTAEIADIKAIVFVRGKRPDKETIELARSKNIPVLATRLLMFESCGMLYENGLIGVSQLKEAVGDA